MDWLEVLSWCRCVAYIAAARNGWWLIGCKVGLLASRFVCGCLGKFVAATGGRVASGSGLGTASRFDVELLFCDGRFVPPSRG